MRSITTVGPPALGEAEEETLLDGLRLELTLGLTDALGLTLGETLEEMLGETLGETLLEGLTEGLTLGETDGLTDEEFPAATATISMPIAAQATEDANVHACASLPAPVP